MDERKSGAGGGVVPAARVRLSGEAVRVGPQRPGEQAGGPQVRLVQEGDVVRAIHVACTCGEEIVIRCEYA